jgi:hypothetical protein
MLGALALIMVQMVRSQDRDPEVAEGRHPRGGRAAAPVAGSAPGSPSASAWCCWSAVRAAGLGRQHGRPELGVPELVIGLTIVAVGTSLPELAATVASALRGHAEIAMGNVIGSNLFNLLVVMAMPGLLAPEQLPENFLARDYGPCASPRCCWPPRVHRPPPPAGAAAPRLSRPRRGRAVLPRLRAVLLLAVRRPPETHERTVPASCRVGAAHHPHGERRPSRRSRRVSATISSAPANSSWRSRAAWWSPAWASPAISAARSPRRWPARAHPPFSSTRRGEPRRHGHDHAARLRPGPVQQRHHAGGADPAAAAQAPRHAPHQHDRRTASTLAQASDAHLTPAWRSRPVPWTWRRPRAPPAPWSWATPWPSRCSRRAASPPRTSPSRTRRRPRAASCCSRSTT